MSDSSAVGVELRWKLRGILPELPVVLGGSGERQDARGPVVAAGRASALENFNLRHHLWWRYILMPCLAAVAWHYVHDEIHHLWQHLLRRLRVGAAVAAKQHAQRIELPTSGGGSACRSGASTECTTGGAKGRRRRHRICAHRRRAAHAASRSRCSAMLLLLEHITQGWNIGRGQTRSLTLSRRSGRGIDFGLRHWRLHLRRLLKAHLRRRSYRHLRLWLSRRLPS